MHRIARFGAFWYDFLVGDDWTLALGAGAAIALTAVLARVGLAAWPAMALATGALLVQSVLRARRASRGSKGHVG